MVQKQVTAQGWLGSTPEGRRPRIRFSLRSQRPGGSGNHGPNQLLSGRVRPLLNGRPAQKSSRFWRFARHDACVRRGRAGSQNHCTKELVKKTTLLILITCTAENAGEIRVPGCPWESSRPSRPRARTEVLAAP